MDVIVIGTGFGARVVAPVYVELGMRTRVISPHDTAAVRSACAGEVDLISVHSPPFLHHSHVMLALDHGRAILCDKPFGRNAQEARQMRDRAKAVGVLNFLNFEFRQSPPRAKLKALLDDGAIGSLQHISWTMIGSGLRHQSHRWLFDASMAGGWIGAYGSHAIDTLRWLTGSEVVQCGGASRIETLSRPNRDGVTTPSTAEDAFSAWFAMANGSTVSFDTAFSAPVGLPQRLILMGSEGALELTDDLTIMLRRPGQDDQNFAFDAPVGDPHLPALLPWLTQVRDAVRDGRQIGPDFDDGVAVAQVMDQLRSNFAAVTRAPLVPQDVA